jgi:hypothetical protein
MKKPFLLLIAIATAMGAHAQAVPAAHGPRISFDKELNDFDTIPRGGDGRCEFVLTNTGDEPLIVSNFQSSCGCLVPWYEKEPVFPGKTTILKARYDTNRVGPFQKSLTLTTNAVDRPTVVLRIKGVVKPNAVEVAPSGGGEVPDR